MIAGETGSGKTTQLPKICLELGRGVRGTIGHTQPRRIAARTVAERIAEELGVELGSAVGYQVRFTDRATEDTAVKVMTDGILLAEIQHDRMLRRYDTLIIDEAHERSLNIDFLLGYLKQLLPRRPDLKLIITSATIDPERFAAALRRRAGRRGLRPDVPGRGPLPPAGGRGRPDRGDHRRGGRARPGGARRRAGLPLRRAGDPGHRGRAAPAPAGRHRGAAAVRPAVRGRPAQGLRAARRPADRAGHERRRDLAHRPRHPVRGRSRHRADLPLQRPDEGAAAADRAGLAGQRGPAQGPLRAYRRRRLHPALRRGGLRRPGPGSPSRRCSGPTWPR